MIATGYYKLSQKCPADITAEVKESRPLFGRCWPQGSRCKILCAIVIVGVVVAATCLNTCCKPTIKSEPVALNTQLTTQEVQPDEKISASSLLRAGKIRYKHTKRRLPQCLIIGARKAGTRALLTFLDLHPQIQTAKNEVHFFDDDDVFAEGYEWYRKKMPYSFPGQITMEKTPAYFTEDVVPERVKQMNTSMKMLLIVRDPVERTISDYVQIRANKEAKNKSYPPFEELAMTEDGEVDKTYTAVRRSLYVRHMAKWLRQFPRSQFLIVSGEGLIEDPVPHIKRIEEFLGIDHRITDQNFFFNETRGFYCIRNETFEKCLAASKGRPHPKVDTVVMKKLRAFFRPWNEKFYEMVQQNFGWL